MEVVFVSSDDNEVHHLPLMYACRNDADVFDRCSIQDAMRSYMKEAHGDWLTGEQARAHGELCRVAHKTCVACMCMQALSSDCLMGEPSRSLGALLPFDSHAHLTIPLAECSVQCRLPTICAMK